MRNSVLKPLVEEYFSWAKEQIAKKTVLPESETGEGLAYSVNQEIYLKAFLEDGDIPIDNSAALSDGITYPHLYPETLVTSGFPEKRCA